MTTRKRKETRAFESVSRYYLCMKEKRAMYCTREKKTKNHGAHTSCPGSSDHYLSAEAEKTARAFEQSTYRAARKRGLEAKIRVPS